MASLLLALMVPFTVAADGTLRGDVNNDGIIDVIDVVKLIDHVLSGQGDELCDVNLDGDKDVADVVVLIDRVLTGTWSDEQQQYEYVDLGLPSGTLWATCNVGASAPEDYGDYFAWGETAPKDNYEWSNYKWCNGSSTTMTKYCTGSSCGADGFTDGKTELDPEDDAAYVNWGPQWRMPTHVQQTELCENCTWTWTTQNGVNGQLGIGPNGNSIFLPAAGGRWDGDLNSAGSHGYYWSRTLAPGYSYSYGAFYMGFSSYGVYWYSIYYRYYGHTVRAVRVP
jgi:hypothetical protein